MKAEECRIVICDDETIIRYALKSVIKSLNLNLVGEGVNGREAIALYEKTKPDLMLLDINMSLYDGDQALKDIRAKYPSANIVMLTSVAESEKVRECIANGALNYILKTNPMNEIKAMIEKIVAEL